MSSIAFIVLLGITPFVFYYDIRYYRIPDFLSLGGWLVLLLSLALFDHSELLNSLAGSLFSFLLFYLCAQILPGKLGQGDMKLVLATGGAAGSLYWDYSLLLSTFLGLGAYLLLKLLKRKDLMALPFGPFLCSGSIIVFIITIIKRGDRTI